MPFALDTSDARRLRASVGGRSAGGMLCIAGLDGAGRRIGEVTFFLGDQTLAHSIAAAINGVDALALGMQPMSTAPQLPIEAYYLDEARYVALEPVLDQGPGAPIWRIAGEEDDATFTDDNFVGWRPLALRDALARSVVAAA